MPGTCYNAQGEYIRTWFAEQLLKSGEVWRENENKGLRALWEDLDKRDL